MIKALEDHASDAQSIDKTPQFRINDTFLGSPSGTDAMLPFSETAQVDEDSDASELDIFCLEPVEFHVSSKLLAVSVESDTVHIVLKGGTLQIINLSEAQNIRSISIPFSEEDQDSECAIFTDPLALHSLISMNNGNNFYHFHNWDSAVLIPQLKGKHTTSVGWFKGNYSEKLNSLSKAALLGFQDGKVAHIEFSSEDKGRKKVARFVTEVYQLPEIEPITGLEIEIFPGRGNNSNILILLTTATRFYQFIENSGNSFSNAPNSPSTFFTFFSVYGKKFYLLEIEGGDETGCLSLYRKYSEYGADSTASSFAWLTSSGVYFGSLSYGSQQAGDSLIESANIIPYSFDYSNVASHVILTEFHIILLIKTRIKAISRLNGETVFDMELPDDEVALHMTVDSTNRTCWILTPTKLIEIVITNESRDVWKTLLEQKKFEASIKYCRSETQKCIVYQAQADHYFDTNRYSLSASYYAKSKAKIEEVAIKYLAKRDISSLKSFLYNKLLLINKKDSLQIMLLATWLVQIFLVMLGILDKTVVIGTSNQGELDSPALNAKEERELLVEEFHMFLDAFTIHLHPKTVLGLISEHGRDDTMIHYLYLLKDYQNIIEHYLLKKDYLNALRVLNQHGSPVDFYKYSEQLISHLPVRLIDTLIRHKSLDSTKLIPALIEYEKTFVSGAFNINTGSPKAETQNETTSTSDHQALRYLEFVIYQLINQNKALHHYFVSLLVKQQSKSESKILEYLEYFSDDPVCDLEFVLSICLKYSRFNSATYVYSLLGYYEDSVNLALKINDIELAIIQINKLGKKRDYFHEFGTENIKELYDLELEKRLWLKVLKHVIQEKQDVNHAIEITKKTNLLGVEDLLVYFPSFDSIGGIKEILCETLEDYEQQVENLYLDMNESMKNANLINSEISNMNSRYSIVAENEPCQICCQPALIKEIYVFPCQHVFHCDCLTRKVLLSSIRINTKKIKALQSQIAGIAKKRRELRLANIGGLLTGIDRKGKSGAANPKNVQNESNVDDVARGLVNSEIKARKELDDLVARECVLCGEPNIKSITVPFVDNDKDQELILSWSL